MARKWMIGIAVLFLLMVGLHLSLSQGLLSEPLRRWTLTTLSRHVGWPIQVDRVTLRLIPSALILSDVRVFQSKNDQKPWLEVKEVRITFSPWSLLTEVTILKKIRLKEPRLLLVPHENEPGGTPWPPSFLRIPSGASSASRKPPSLVIREIEIQQGTLIAQPTRMDLQVGLEAMEGKILPDLRMENFQVLLTSGRTAIRFRNIERTFDHAQVKLSIDPDHVEVRSAELGNPEIRVAVSGSLTDLNDPQYTLSVETTFPLSELGTFFHLEQRLAGKARLHGEVVGQQRNATISGDLAIRDLALNDHPIGEVKASFEYKDKTLRWSDLSSSILGGEVQGHATVDLSRPSPPYQASLALSRLSAGRLAALLGRPDTFVDQILDGQVELSGQGQERSSLSGRGKLNLYLKSGVTTPESPPQNFKEWTRHLKEVTADFELDQGVLELKEALLRSTESQASLKGRIGTHNELDLHFHLTSQMAQELTPLLKMGYLHGSLDLSGALRGTLKTPEVNADGLMQNATIRGRPFEQISGHFTYRPPKLVFASARFREKQALYELDGMVSFDASLPSRPFFDLKAKITNGLPREVVAIFSRELPITSAVTGNLKAAGRPKEFKLSAQLSVGPGAIYGQEIDSGRLELTVTHQKVSFEKVEAKYQGSVASGEGWIQYDGHFKVALTSSQTDLKDITWARKPLGDMAAVVSGKLQGEGLLKNPEFQAELLLRNVTYHNQPFGAGTLNGSLINNVLTFEASLDKGIAGKGQLTLVAPFPFQTDLTLNRFEAKPFLDLLGPSYLAKVSVSASGTLTAAGSLKDLARTRLTLHLHEFTFDLAGYLLSNEGDIHLELTAQILQIQSLRLKGEDTSLAITGSLELYKSYHLFINGEADLDLFRAISQEVTYGRGKVYLALQVLDQWENPDIRGGLTIQDGTLKSATLNQAVTIKSLGFSFNERQILLESFDGEVGGGKLTASGKWNLAGFTITDFGLNLELTAVRIRNVQGLSGSFDAFLLFQGNSQSKSLKGEVIIRQASFERRLDWQSWVLDFLKRQSRKPQAIPVVGETTLNIRVVGKENIKINNNLAKLPLEMDLLIKGTMNQPVLLGRMEANGGVIFFRRNEFKIISGTVDFIDPDRIRPIFDIKATTRVRTYQINLSLVGPMDRFDLSLSSDPPLKDQTEILALLTFGKTPEEISQASKEIGATEAASLFTGEIQAAVEERVEAITGIDRIQFEPYYSSTKAAGTPRVTVSKRLWEDRFYVTYATTLDPAGEEVIQMEYILSNNVSLVGGRDELGRVGGDLKFRFEFR